MSILDALFAMVHGPIRVYHRLVATPATPSRIFSQPGRSVSRTSKAADDRRLVPASHLSLSPKRAAAAAASVMVFAVTVQASRRFPELVSDDDTLWKTRSWCPTSRWATETST